MWLAIVALLLFLLAKQVDSLVKKMFTLSKLELE